MKYGITLRWKRIKTVPKVFVLSLALLIISFFVCVINLVGTSSRWIDRIEEKNIIITDAYVFDSHDIKGSRFKLVIESNDDRFYLWYPKDSFSKYRGVIASDLLNGSTNQVSAKVISNSTLWDVISGQCKIEDLRAGDTVFYDLDDEILRQKDSRYTYLIAAAFLSALLVSGTTLISISYGIVRLTKKHPADRRRRK